MPRYFSLSFKDAMTVIDGVQAALSVFEIEPVLFKVSAIGINSVCSTEDVRAEEIFRQLADFKGIEYMETAQYFTPGSVVKTVLKFEV